MDKIWILEQRNNELWKQLALVNEEKMEESASKIEESAEEKNDEPKKKRIERSEKWKNKDGNSRGNRAVSQFAFYFNWSRSKMIKVPSQSYLQMKINAVYVNLVLLKILIISVSEKRKIQYETWNSLKKGMKKECFWIIKNYRSIWTSSTWVVYNSFSRILIEKWKCQEWNLFNFWKRPG